MPTLTPEKPHRHRGGRFHRIDSSGRRVPRYPVPSLVRFLIVLVLVLGLVWLAAHHFNR